VSTPGNGMLVAMSFPTLLEAPRGFVAGNGPCPDLHETAFDAVQIEQSLQNSFLRLYFQEQC